MDWSNLTDDQIGKLSDMIFLAYEEGFIDGGGLELPCDSMTMTQHWEKSITLHQDLCELRERFQVKDND